MMGIKINSNVRYINNSSDVYYYLTLDHTWLDWNGKSWVRGTRNGTYAKKYDTYKKAYNARKELLK